MDDVLKSIYLRLDSTTRSLTKNAISQLLIKIIYFKEYSSKSDIILEYKNIIHIKQINDDDIDNCLRSLVTNHEIILNKGSYHLSASKRDKIRDSCEASSNRKKNIIDRFFRPYFSKDDAIADWLDDATICFFKSFANEWISDLCYKVKAIADCKDNIISIIEKRTKNNIKLDRQDLKDLPIKFIDFITKKDGDVENYLWEYGTSSFSAQLINNSMGADDFSIETFKDSKCVLDTNILMNIGLESSEYCSALKSLEDIFNKLDIEIGILYITKQEYENTVNKKKDEIIRMVEKFSPKVIKKINDQYIQTAIKRGCYNATDFEAFFKPLLNVPQYLCEKIKISILDDDIELENEIQKSQKDEDKQKKLNAIYKHCTGHEKRQNALIHDVGLINGVNYLRRCNGKYFILSQESSVNNYAKENPSVENLPISIKLETIINVLAINNGGIDINTKDYIPLFASMIREYMIPNKDSFKIADLSLMLERNEQIAHLPPDETIRIAEHVHRKRLLGEDDEKIGLELTREIQDVKIKIVDELAETRSQLFYEKEEKGRYKIQADESEKKLKDTVTKIVEDKYDKKIKKTKLKYYYIIPIIIFLVIGLICFVVIYFTKWKLSSIIISILINILTDLLIIFFSGTPKIKRLRKDRSSVISKEVGRMIDNN